MIDGESDGPTMERKQWPPFEPYFARPDPVYRQMKQPSFNLDSNLININPVSYGVTN